MKLKASNQWLNDKMVACNGFGEKALRNALDDASFIENKLGPLTEQNRGLVNESIRYIRYHLDSLCNLISQGQVIFLLFFIFQGLIKPDRNLFAFKIFLKYKLK